MSRITIMAAKEIARAACRASFAKELECEKKREAALAMQGYEASFPADVRKLAKKLPEKWLCYDSCLRFNCGGWDVRLSVLNPVPVPMSLECRRLSSLPDDLSLKIREFITQKDARKKEREKVELDLAASILSSVTYKKLQQAWPEGEPHYRRYLEMEARRGTALAVPFAQINVTLGIEAHAPAP